MVVKFENDDKSSNKSPYNVILSHILFAVKPTKSRFCFYRKFFRISFTLTISLVFFSPSSRIFCGCISVRVVWLYATETDLANLSKEELIENLLGAPRMHWGLETWVWKRSGTKDLREAGKEASLGTVWPECCH